MKAVESASATAAGRSPLPGAARDPDPDGAAAPRRGPCAGRGCGRPSAVPEALSALLPRRDPRQDLRGPGLRARSC